MLKKGSKKGSKKAKPSLLKRHKGKIALTFGLITIITISFLVAARFELQKSTDENFDMGSANCAVNVLYYGLYENETVSIPIENAPWSIGGTIIDELGIDVSWIVTGDYIDWSTLGVGGSIKLYRLNYYGLEPVDITPSSVGLPFTRSGVDAMDVTLPYHISLDTLLEGVSPSGATTTGTYWEIRVEVTVTGQATDDYGTIHTETTGKITATYVIYDVATAGFSITGTIT